MVRKGMVKERKINGLIFFLLRVNMRVQIKREEKEETGVDQQVIILARWDTSTKYTCKYSIYTLNSWGHRVRGQGQLWPCVKV